MWKQRKNKDYTIYYGKPTIVYYSYNENEDIQCKKGRLNYINTNTRNITSVSLIVNNSYESNNVIVGDLIKSIKVDISEETFPLIHEETKNHIGMDISNIIIEFVDKYIEI
tara:strand:- start:769 stop:1101 length:333 start_codon:yes stop_codon:yes gene_type:complete